MHTSLQPSGLRFDKLRVSARLTLTGGIRYDGCFFVASVAAHHDGPERVSDLLGSAGGFVPFEAADAIGTTTRVINPAHIVVVALDSDEASRDPGYAVGRLQPVSLRLTTGDVIEGTIRVGGPEGQSRLSDWTRQPDRFRYVETGHGLLLVNTAHLVEASEVSA